jgi:hypothetical protein
MNEQPEGQLDCANLTKKPMEKLMIKNVLNKFGFVRIALVAGAVLPLLFA